MSPFFSSKDLVDRKHGHPNLTSKLRMQIYYSIYFWVQLFTIMY